MRIDPKRVIQSLRIVLAGKHQAIARGSKVRFFEWRRSNRAYFLKKTNTDEILTFKVTKLMLNSSAFYRQAFHDWLLV